MTEWNPLRPFILWYNERVMHKFLRPSLDNTVREFVRDQGQVVDGVKTINYLAVKEYMKEEQTGREKAASAVEISPQFYEVAMNQLKVFIFAGHDTTASTVSFAFSRLFRDPKILAATRAEHDAVLGPDPNDAARRLVEDPSLVRQMPYTLAVIKETLRLYPPAATIRTTKFLKTRGTTVTNPETGKRYPLDGFSIWNSHASVHLSPNYWERPDEFLPERWLVEEGHPLHPQKNAFRPVSDHSNFQP